MSAIYLKLLDDAIRDGDPIRAVIRGTALNSDGKTPGMSLPSIESQKALIKQAYEVSGLLETAISQTPFVECHGTGTPAGDRIETNAVAAVFGSDHKTYIGSVSLILRFFAEGFLTDSRSNQTLAIVKGRLA